MKAQTILFLFAFGVTLIFCSKEEEMKNLELSIEPAVAQKALNQLLSANVDSSGKVNYAAIRENPFALNTFLKFIRTVSPETSPELFPTENDRKAYWINVYNALVMQAVIEHPNISSVKDIAWGNGVFWRKSFVVGGRKLTLDTIEKEMLQKRYHDPRVHFAINCASASCPPLGQRIFTGENLDAQLDKKVTTFLNNPVTICLDTSQRVIRLSRIFKWYLSDFEQDRNSVLDYIDHYSKIIDLTENLDLSNWTIEYEDYNWSLNRFD